MSIGTLVRAGAYHDAVALMQVARTEEAQEPMIGSCPKKRRTPA